VAQARLADFLKEHRKRVNNGNGEVSPKMTFSEAKCCVQGFAFGNGSPPLKVLVIPNVGVRLLASLCRELQEMARNRSFMLCQASIAQLFGHPSHRNVSNWIRALKTLGVLKLAEAAIANARAARYFYIE
jgi:hypothetical protein